jgi:uncharacterized membrane protein
MKTIAKLALSGLITVLPVTVTLYVIWWLASGAEALLGRLLRFVLPERLYVPGAGLVLGLLLLVGLGLLMRAVIARRIEGVLRALMDRIPLVKTVYGSVSDLLSMFTKREAGKIDQVVLVTVADPCIRVLGLVTRRAVPELDAGPDDDPFAVVYVPMSYGIGGYPLLVRKSALTPLRMSVEQALRFAITAGAPSKSA